MCYIALQSMRQYLESLNFYQDEYCSGTQKKRKEVLGSSPLLDIGRFNNRGSGALVERGVIHEGAL